jgi:hypothetical protein
MTCYDGRPYAEDSIGRDTQKEDGRLSIGGLAQLFRGSVTDDAREWIAEGIVGFVEHAPDDRVRLVQISTHADPLRSLAGEDESDLL